MREQKIGVKNIQKTFFEMEASEDLFEIRTANGVYIWDVCRLHVYQKLLSTCGVGFVSDDFSIKRPLVDLFKKFIYRIRNFLSSFYLSTKKPEYLFITAQRTRVDHCFRDNISDHLLEIIDGYSVSIELLNKGAINYFKIILGLETRIPPVFVQGLEDDSDLMLAHKKISKLVYKHFGIHLDFRNIVFNSISEFQSNYCFYSRFFSKHRPKAIIGVNNATLHGLYAAAKDFNIPTIELQHGASCVGTLLWSYPKSISSDHPGLSLPTAYLTVSDYWIGNSHYPVKMIRSIGNDNLYQEPIIVSDGGV